MNKLPQDRLRQNYGLSPYTEEECLLELQKEVKNGKNLYDNKKAWLQACRDGYINVIKYLAENVADIHVYNNRGMKECIRLIKFNALKYLVEKIKIPVTKSIVIYAYYCKSYGQEQQEREIIYDYLKTKTKPLTWFDKFTTNFMSFRS